MKKVLLLILIFKTVYSVNFTGSIQCPLEIKPCPVSRYYSVDGSCNNIRISWAGQSHSPYSRILPAMYDNGVSTPRTRSIVNNAPLPNPRRVSLNVHYPRWFPSNEFYRITNFNVMLSQYIAFDMTRATPTATTCICDEPNPDCVNIPTPPGDNLDANQKCMVTPRSVGSFPTFNCRFQQREQLNQETHWLDLSQLYGFDGSVNSKLRDRGGLLKVTRIPGFPNTYLSFASPNTCNFETPRERCFLSGDPRVNENMVLTSVFTCWAREHNRIVAILSRINPQWNDERLYQEARRILIAIYQKIVYEDYLPIIVGPRMITKNGLNPSNGYFKGYNSEINPQIWNEFGTGAFRYGHTLVQAWGFRADRFLNIIGNISMRALLLQPHHAYVSSGLDGLLMGSLVGYSDLYNAYLTDPIQNHLFENPDPKAQTHQQSLSTLNINRGRDHGIPPYNSYREFCGLPKARSFDDLIEFTRDTIADLKTVYKNVNDIDWWTGLVSERPIPGAVVGPTAACIISRQFSIIKSADRLFYENGQDRLTRFSPPQLDEIKRVTLASIICDNYDIDVIQPNVLLTAQSSRSNSPVSCRQIPKMNFQLWKE